MSILQGSAVRLALAAAWAQVRSKAAAPGLDGIDVTDFQKDVICQLENPLTPRDRRLNWHCAC